MVKSDKYRWTDSIEVPGCVSAARAVSGAAGEKTRLFQGISEPLRSWPKERIDSACHHGHDRRVWTTRDSDGRVVVLTGDRWAHVLDRHPYLGLSPEDIVDTVTHPDARVAGRASYEEWFYRRGVGPSTWTKVVVHYEDERGLVVTAFPRRSFP